MTSEDQTEDDLDRAVRAGQIKTLFRSARKALTEHITEMDGLAADEVKDLKAKLNELRHALAALLKAEDAFHAGRDEPEVIDYDAIRNDVGCALDRIRSAESAG